MNIIGLLLISLIFQLEGEGEVPILDSMVYPGEFDDSSEDFWNVFNPEYNLGRSIGWTWVASSELQPQGAFDYSVSNISDISKATAWVEGVSGTGEGEVLTAVFHDQSTAEAAPCWGMVLINGYAKSGNAYYANARVREMLLLLNGTPLFILELEDTIQPQSFHWSDDQIFLSGSDVIELEILSTYPGLSYEDTAITELTFLGGGEPTNQ